MKTFLVAFLTSLLTAMGTVWFLQDRKITSLPAAGVLTVRELRVVDRAGKVRATLGMLAADAGTAEFGPSLEFIAPKAENRGGVSLRLDQNGLGTLYFNSEQTDAKVAVGHHNGCDTNPYEEKDCGFWGLLLRNPRPAPTAPDEMMFVVGNKGGTETTTSHVAGKREVRPVQVPSAK